MLKLSRLFPLAVLALALAAPAQTTTAGRILSRIDLGLSGTGVFTSTASGSNYLNQALSVQPSSTAGGAVQLRYTQSHLLGFETTYTLARYTQNYTCCITGGVQNNVQELTGGYVLHGPTILSVIPFASIGAGATKFKPTANGGQSYLQQYRATYYYTVGFDAPLYRQTVYLRAQFRQLLYLAPDFGQNYLTIKQRAITSEPAVGFVFRF